MIEIIWGSKKSGTHYLVPFAWLSWPRIFVENNYYRIKAVLLGRDNPELWQAYPTFYEHDPNESPDERNERIAKINEQNRIEQAEWIEKAKEMEKKLRRK